MSRVHCDQIRRLARFLWVGDGEFDAALAGSVNGFFQIWVVSRPFNIEDAPDLVDLAVLVSGSAAGIDRHGDEGLWDGPSVSGFDSEIDSGHVAYCRLPLQSFKVLRFGSFSFAEDQERFRGCRIATRRLSGRSPTLPRLANIMHRSKPTPRPGAV